MGGMRIGTEPHAFACPSDGAARLANAVSQSRHQPKRACRQRTNALRTQPSSAKRYPTLSAAPFASAAAHRHDARQFSVRWSAQIDGNPNVTPARNSFTGRLLISA